MNINEQHLIELRKLALEMAVNTLPQSHTDDIIERAERLVGFLSGATTDGEITEWHLHEMLDRAHTLDVMFAQLIASHPAAELLADEIERAGEALHALYQRAGEVSL